MLLSLDPLEDIELKRQEIKRKTDKTQMEDLLEENSALQRLDERGLDLRAYEPAEYNSAQANNRTDCGKSLTWSVSEVSSLADKGQASRTHIRTVIERGLG